MVSRVIQVTEIDVIVRKNLVMARFLLFTDLILAQVTFGHLGGPGFGLMSPVSKSRMKSEKVLELVELILMIS